MMRRIIFFLFLLAGFSGCRILHPSLMFKTPKNFQYSEFQDSTLSSREYKIAENDIIEFQIFSNDGFKLIDLTSMGDNNQWSAVRNSMQLTVEFDGNVKLPVLGRTLIKGYTLRQAEIMLEEKYAAYYNKPFILLKVTNRRVMVFPGAGGSGRVITLSNNNTTLVEALALAGGITTEGKAYKVKLVRGNLRDPQVYKIDLSTIEGIKKADLVVQANDIIYVEPKLNFGREVLNEITPIISLITSTLLVYGLFVKK